MGPNRVRVQPHRLGDGRHIHRRVGIAQEFENGDPTDAGEHAVGAGVKGFDRHQTSFPYIYGKNN